MNDLLKSISTINEIEISYSSIILSIFISTICSIIIKNAYVKYGRSLNNKRNFLIFYFIMHNHNITVVKFSFALSLGLVGALNRKI